MSSQTVQESNQPDDLVDTADNTTERVLTANESGLFALVVILAVIAIPIFFVLMIFINLAGTICATILFEVIGHCLMRAYGHHGANIRLLSSVKVGAVGGAIVAIPFNILYSTLEGLLSPPVVVQDLEDQGASEPLLQAQEQDEQQAQGTGTIKGINAIHGTTRVITDGLRGTRHNPFGQRLYSSQRVVGVEPPSQIRVAFALLVDFLSGPALGALAGAVGSWVLRKSGHHTLEVGSAAEAGAIGGLVLGGLTAFIFSALCTCALGAFWMSRRS